MHLAVSRPRKRAAARKVVSLYGAAPPIPQVIPEVVERLTELLARAKDGQLVGIAWVAVDPQGGTLYSHDGAADADRLIASTARLYHGMLADSRDAKA